MKRLVGVKGKVSPADLFVRPYDRKPAIQLSSQNGTIWSEDMKTSVI